MPFFDKTKNDSCERPELILAQSHNLGVGVLNGSDKIQVGLKKIWVGLDNDPLILIWASSGLDFHSPARPDSFFFLLKIILIPIYQFIIIKLKTLSYIIFKLYINYAIYKGPFLTLIEPVFIARLHFNYQPGPF